MAFPTTPLLDSFNRTDETPAVGWAGSGAAGNLSSIKVVSNTAKGNVASGAFEAYYTASQFGPNCEVYFTVTTVPLATESCWVAFRLKDVGSTTTVDGYEVEFIKQAGTDIIRVWEFVDGGGFVQNGADISQEFGVNDQLGARMTVDTIEVMRNGVVLATRTDTTFTGAGYIGAGGSGTTVAFDNFGGGSTTKRLAALGAG